jgi:hypothetical protein
MQTFVCTSPDLKDACDAAGPGVVEAASADRRDPPALRPTASAWSVTHVLTTVCYLIASRTAGQSEHR